VPKGTPIYAAASGEISFVGTLSGYGKVIYLTHSDGKTSVYAHLSQFAVNNRAKVKKGDLIGYSGNTGVSSGPHLHFELKNELGQAVNPQSYGYFTG
jgi:murein DD-endopeptidase MepM/ murein hydrolase activator NlpD